MRGGGADAAGRRGSPVLARLRDEESGADMIEYALIATLVALGAIAAIDSVGDKIANYYRSIGSSL
jgi:pilus assembly protein Flp/PilA